MVLQKCFKTKDPTEISSESFTLKPLEIDGLQLTSFQKLFPQKVFLEDIPWLVENLEDLYDKAVDVRTKNFIIVAAGSLKSELCLGLLRRGLGEDDSGTVFHAIVALSNFPKGIEFDWSQIISFWSQMMKA